MRNVRLKDCSLFQDPTGILIKARGPGQIFGRNRNRKQNPDAANLRL